ncbi:hypothetical protein B0H15DRAFT_1007301 [Mycena belliarum]|uniref:Uncharacterized protein n=1 Tax=Mycena belliarum TaxID=1033014 RepID=A0AAD6TSZ7_9AGAR|nr:hypothetical protein B0H15DRAFT_1007301 [Mycena belliae]
MDGLAAGRENVSSRARVRGADAAGRTRRETVAPMRGSMRRYTLCTRRTAPPRATGRMRPAAHRRRIASGTGSKSRGMRLGREISQARGGRKQRRRAARLASGDDPERSAPIELRASRGRDWYQVPQNASARFCRGRDQRGRGGEIRAYLLYTQRLGSKFSIKVYPGVEGQSHPRSASNETYLGKNEHSFGISERDTKVSCVFESALNEAYLGANEHSFGISEHNTEHSFGISEHNTEELSRMNQVSVGATEWKKGAY